MHKFAFDEQVWGLRLYQNRDSAQVFSCEFCEISNNTFS